MVAKKRGNDIRGLLFCHTWYIHRVSKKCATFILYNNFGKHGPIFIIFSLLNSERICGKKDGIKTTISPQIWCHTTLWKVSGQLYRFTAQLIQFKLMKKCLITVNVHNWCYVCFSTKNNLRYVFKSNSIESFILWGFSMAGHLHQRFGVLSWATYDNLSPV